MLIRSSAVLPRQVSVFLPRAALPLALLLALLLLVAPTAAWAAGPSISVSPTTGTAGDPLTVSGAGWPAGDDIQVQIGGATVCQLVASAQGSISGDGANGCRVPPGLSAGSYALTADDLTNGSEQAAGPSFTVPAGPLVSAFNPTSATVLAGSPVAFDASGSSDPGGDISSYSWNFGDRTAATGVQTTHSYLVTGTFDVTLTVTDSSGDTSSVTHQITVIAPPPIQTLILTPVATPAIVKWATVATAPSGVVNLGERVFCPGPGPGCNAFVLATSRSLPTVSHTGTGIVSGSARAGTVVGKAAITISPADSAELTLKLSRQARASLRTHHVLPVQVKIVVVRGGQTTTTSRRLTFRLR